MNIEVIFDKLFDYYGINSFVDLAEKLNISQPALSQWKTRNSISAIKKKCRELGIYNDIFSEINSKNISISEAIKINNTLLKKAKNEASKFGLDISSYLEHLIIQDLKK